jgi:hypothetical protein
LTLEGEIVDTSSMSTTTRKMHEKGFKDTSTWDINDVNTKFEEGVVPEIDSKAQRIMSGIKDFK